MNKKVTYAEIIDALAGKTGFSKQKSEAFSKALIAEVKEELQETGKATITNFGSFKVKRVSERQGQNPQTGEPITIPAHNRVSFTPYKALKETVNEKYAHLETELVGQKEETSSLDIQEETEDESPIIPEKRERKRPGSNTGLILVAVLILVVIAIVSAWFLISPSTENVMPQQAAVEQPERPETVSQVSKESSAQLQTDDSNSAEMNVETPPSKKVEMVNPETVKQTEVGSVNTEIVYRVQKDDWYWVISEKVYGRSRFWPLLFMKNQTLKDDPDRLYPSTGLEIPRMEGTVEAPTKSDYARLAKASKMVSEAYLNFNKKEKSDDYARFAKKWMRLSQAN